MCSKDSGDPRGYDIGDTGVISADRCGCGSFLPVLEGLTGRVTDHFFHLFYF